MFPGPFAYAERWDEAGKKYLGLSIEKVANPHIVIDSDSIIIKPDVAEAHRSAAAGEASTGAGESVGGSVTTDTIGDNTAAANANTAGGVDRKDEILPTRFIGTVMISADRPARDMHQIVEAIVEKLTTIPGSDVSLKLEINAEVSEGLDRAKVRTLMENATTLGFIDKLVK